MGDWNVVVGEGQDKSVVRNFVGWDKEIPGSKDWLTSVSKKDI